MTALTRPDRRDERGAVAVLVAVLSIVLFMLAALVVDLGKTRDAKRQAQNAADAAALAAGNKLYGADGVANKAAAISEAKTYALKNFNIPDSAWASCTDTAKLAHVVSSTTQCISFDDGTRPTKVRVKLPMMNVKTGFANVAGVDNIRIDGTARAALKPGTRVECSLCVVGSIPHSIGNGDVSVLTVTGGGGIHLNGSLSGQSNSNVTAPAGITIEGSWSSQPNYTPTPVPGPKIEDPFADKALPTTFTGTPKTDPCTQGPGIYNVDYRVGSGDTCNLQAGLYVFTGVLSLNNTSKIVGSGVSLYFTCRTGTTPRACNANSGAGEPGGEFDARNGEVNITAGAAPISNFVVAYDRNNTSNISLQGNGNSVLTGDVYAVRALLDANGNACHTVRNGSIIVNDIYLNGNPSCLNIQSGIPAVYVAPPAGLHLDQ